MHNYQPGIALDEATLRGLANMPVSVTDDETGLPVQVYRAEMPVPQLITGPHGFIPEFQTEESTRRVRVTVSTYSLTVWADEIMGGAQDAADRAEAAADRAESTAADLDGLRDAVDETVAQSPADSAVASVLGRTDTLSRRAVEEAMSDSLMVVAHGEDALRARPDTMRRVMWVGSVLPVYREPGDLVLEAAALPVPFSPASLDLIGWHDATAPGFATGTLASIPDRSGMGSHLDVAVGTTAPTWEASGINDLPAFSFQGGGLAASKLGKAWEHPVSVYLVASVRDLSPMASFFFEGAGSQRAAVWTGTAGRAAVTVTSTVQTAAGSIVQDVPVLIRGTFGAGSDSAVAVNGGATVTGSTGASTPTSYRLGADAAGGRAVNALIGEVIVARSVTAEQDAKTVTYLREKWGTP